MEIDSIIEEVYNFAINLTIFFSTIILRDIVGRLKENPEHYGAEGGSVNLQKDKTKKENKKSCC